MSGAVRASHTYYDFSGLVARRYDAFNHLASLGLDVYWRWVTAGRVRRFLSGRTGPRRVLDLAAGTMDMVLAVRKRVRGIPGVEFAASDLSVEMLQLGREKLERKGAREVRVVQAAGSLPLAEGSITAITCAFGVRNFAALDGELEELHRVLQPGGRFYTLEFFAPENGFHRLLLALFRKLLFPLNALILKGDRESYQYLVRSIERFCTVPQYRARLAARGLEPAGTRRFFFGLVHLVAGEKRKP